MASDGGVDREDKHTLIPETVGALTDGAHNGGGLTAKTHTPDEYLPAAAGCIQERDAKGADSDTKPGHLIPVLRGGFFDDRPAHALTGEGFDASEDGTGRGTPLVAAAIAFDTTQITSQNNRSHPVAGDPCHPLSESSHPPAIAQSVGVRRLTPMECERLQGFPDGWTEGFADGPRYKMLGNAVAVPCAEWLGRRINR